MNDLLRQGMSHHLQDAQRQAPGVGIVLAEIGPSLFRQFRCPGLIRRSILETPGEIEEDGFWRTAIQSFGAIRIEAVVFPHA